MSVTTDKAPASAARALAMPIDTAVAAITKQIASATVANSSTPARRRLANDFSDSEMGDVKPIFPVSPVMVVILVAVFVRRARDAANQFCIVVRFGREAGTGSSEPWRSH